MIIRNSEKDKKAFAKSVKSCGSHHVEFTEEDIAAINAGLCVALYDGEYTTFITKAPYEWER